MESDHPAASRWSHGHTRWVSKLAFVGAHGTGKTTLARALLERLDADGRLASVVPEVPRIVCDSVSSPEFFRRGRNSPLRQLLLLLGQPIYEALCARTGEIVICDRALLDHWAYTRCLFDRQLAEEGVRDVLNSLVKKYAETYDLVFYIPIEFPPVDDGTREDDIRFQREIDEEIVQLLTSYKIDYSQIAGSLAQRLESVLSELSDLLRSRPE